MKKRQSKSSRSSSGDFSTTVCTERGYRFIIELYDNRKRCVFVDAARGYKKVATANVPASIADDYRSLEGHLRGVARHILSKYAAQYLSDREDLVLHEDIRLTPAEMTAGIGKPATAWATRRPQVERK
jgi:uncharacterized protein (UPF0218 family)